MSFRYRRMLCALLLTALLFALCGEALASSMPCYINADTKVYQHWSTSSASIRVKKNTPATMTGYNDRWARVVRGDITAYVPLKYITLKNRMTAYAAQDTTLYKGASTSKKLCGIAQGTTVYVIGRESGYFRVQNKSASMTGYVKAAHISFSKPDLKSKVIKMDWYDGGSDLLDRGERAKLYDIKSGAYINVRRLGGTGHADLEPVSTEDTATLKRISGGEFSWDSRPVILIAHGKYVACAINTMPQGNQTNSSNGFGGQFCLHMVGSRTQDTNTVNEAHQRAIQAAYEWAHGR